MKTGLWVVGVLVTVASPQDFAFARVCKPTYAKYEIQINKTKFCACPDESMRRENYTYRAKSWGCPTECTVEKADNWARCADVATKIAVSRIRCDQSQYCKPDSVQSMTKRAILWHGAKPEKPPGCTGFAVSFCKRK